MEWSQVALVPQQQHDIISPTPSSIPDIVSPTPADFDLDHVHFDFYNDTKPKMASSFADSNFGRLIIPDIACTSAAVLPSMPSSHTLSLANHQRLEPHPGTWTVNTDSSTLEPEPIYEQSPRKRKAKQHARKSTDSIVESDEEVCHMTFEDGYDIDEADEADEINDDEDIDDDIVDNENSDLDSEMDSTLLKTARKTSRRELMKLKKSAGLMIPTSNTMPRGRRRHKQLSKMSKAERELETVNKREKARQSARDCRARKKIYIANLEKLVTDLVAKKLGYKAKIEELTKTVGHLEQRLDTLRTV